MFPSSETSISDNQILTNSITVDDYCKYIISGVFAPKMHIPPGINIPKLLYGNIKWIAKYFGAICKTLLRYINNIFYVLNTRTLEWEIKDIRYIKNSLFNQLDRFYDHALEYIDIHSFAYPAIKRSKSNILISKHRNQTITYFIRSVTDTTSKINSISNKNVYHRYANFIDKCCILNPKERVLARDLYNAYINFVGDPHDTFCTFGREIVKINGVSKLAHTKTYYSGIYLP